MPSADSTAMRAKSLWKAQMERPSMPCTCAQLHSLAAYLGISDEGSTTFRKDMAPPRLLLEAEAAPPTVAVELEEVAEGGKS